MKKPVLLLLAVATLSAADYLAEGKRWWAHVEVLASDSLAGRYLGSEGFQQAIQYVAGEFQKLGLQPGGKSGYLQPVRFDIRTVIQEESSLALVQEGESLPLILGQDALINSRPGLVPSLEAPLVFVGYGLSIPEVQFDDLAGVNLKGKVAVYVNAIGPAPVEGNVRSHYSSAAERWATLKKAGAIGIAVLPTPRATNAPAPATAAPRTPQPFTSLADPELQDAEGQKITLSLGRSAAAKLFEGSGHTWAEIEKLAVDNRVLPRFPLAYSLLAITAQRRQTLEAPNVVGIYPGSDPQLKNEYVILSAHTDHMGIGAAVNGDSIYNGAMDDGSGVASLLEIARLLKDSGAKPKRSILFLAVCGEEEGELGSRYFAAHPTVAARQIVADINMDMFLPLYPLKVLEVQGLTESTLGEQVRLAAEAEGVAVQTDREPEQNRFIRSDQYSFIRAGVPSLAFKFGYEFGSPEEKIRREWVNTRYHKPSDDLSQPVDLAAAARFDRVILGLIERVADDAERPSWYSNSFFRRFAK